MLRFDLHASSRERLIPTGGVVQRNHKIIGVRQRTLDLLARGQRHYHDGALAAGIEHVCLEIDGGVLGGNGGQIARGGMTVLAATGSIEKHLSGPWIASKQFLYWVFARDPS